MFSNGLANQNKRAQFVTGKLVTLPLLLTSSQEP